MSGSFLKLSHKRGKKPICLFVRKRRGFSGRFSFLACLASLILWFLLSQRCECTIVSDVSIATVRMLLAFQLLAGARHCCMERLKGSTFPHLLTFHSISPVIKGKKPTTPATRQSDRRHFFFFFSLPEKPKICPWSAWKVEPWRQHRR